jgi:hypothetical protein
MGCLLRVLCAIGRRTFGSPASPERDRILRIHRGTFSIAVWGLLRKGGTAEMALGSAVTHGLLE